MKRYFLRISKSPNLITGWKKQTAEKKKKKRGKNVIKFRSVGPIRKYN
jgi:hypothetical protein